VQFANNAVVRSQNIAGARQKSGRITLWGLDPALKYELERVAAEEGLSLSHVGAIACEQWVHQRLHDRHEALLYPTMRQLVRDENRALGNRLVFFQMRTAFAAEQTRILTTNILSRFLKQQGVPDDTFNTLVDKSNKMSKRNIIARTPELKSLMEEWFASLPDDTENHDREEKK
jgi:hypothetical protein